MVKRVRRDLVRGLKEASRRPPRTHGAAGAALAGRDARQELGLSLPERIAKGVTLRQFTDFHCDAVTNMTCSTAASNRLRPQTLKANNDMVVQAAVTRGLEDGTKLRVDTWLRPIFIARPTTLYVGRDTRRHAPDLPPCQGSGAATHKPQSALAAE